MTPPAQTAVLYESLLTPLLPGPWLQVVLCLLFPHSHIHLHTDGDEKVRYHIPLDINQECWQYHDGTWQQLEVGQLYVVDHTRPHGSLNWGTTLRIHLMVDLVENAE